MKFLGRDETQIYPGETKSEAFQWDRAERAEGQRSLLLHRSAKKDAPLPPPSPPFGGRESDLLTLRNDLIGFRP